MESIDDFADDRQRSWCVYCGSILASQAVNIDHVPARTFLRKPYPANLPKIPSCAKCNASFSKDEQYLSTFLSCVIAGTTEPNDQLKPEVGRALDRSEKLRARIDNARVVCNLGNEQKTLWKPEWKRVNAVIIKNARAHMFYEHTEPMLTQPIQAITHPLMNLDENTRHNFEIIDYGSALPEVGSRMLTRMYTGEDMVNGWIIVQEGSYRYAAFHHEDLAIVRMVFSEYLGGEIVWQCL